MSRGDAEGTPSSSALSTFFADLRERAGGPSYGLIADFAGLSRTYTYNVMKGAKRPSDRAVVAIVRALRGTETDLATARRLARDLPRAAGPVVRPADLPGEPRAFAGRRGDLERLSAAVERSRLVLVTGIAGIGKSWLARRWAYDHLERFPAGQLYADLHGFDGTLRPAAPSEVIEKFLVSLGVAKLPAGGHRQAALYRRLTDRAMLVVLDNAHDAEQVRELLPGGRATVLVTSRNGLADLQVRQEAPRIVVEPMTPAESREALVLRLGEDRLAEEAEAAAEVIDICAGHALALGIVGAALSTRPQWTLTSLAADLGNESRRLRVLDGLSTVLSWSDRFVAPQRRSLCLLSAAPVPDLAVDSAAALLGTPEPDAHDLLRECEGAGLIHQVASFRFSMHPLVRLYWAEQRPAVLDEAETDAAVRRLVDFLLHTAWAGERLLSPERPAVVPEPPAEGVMITPPPAEASAMAWFDAENATLTAAQLVAAERGWDTTAWQLAWSMDNYLYRRGRIEQHERMWRAGREAASRLGDPRVLALAELCLGRVSGDVSPLERALELIPDDDRVSRAQAHRAMALASEPRERRRALHHTIAALRLFRELGEPVWEAVQLNALGEELAELGHPETGRTLCEQALRFHSENKDRAKEAAAEDGLGTVERIAGMIDAAERHYDRAVEIYLEVGNESSAADTLVRLGEALRPTDRSKAEHHLRRAFDLYRSQRRVDEMDRVRKLIGR